MKTFPHRNGVLHDESAQHDSTADLLSWLTRLASLLPKGGSLQPCHVQVRHAGFVVTFSIDRVPVVSEPLLNAGQLEAKILLCVGSQPMLAKQIAGRIGRKCNSHFRSVIRGMCKNGLLRRLGEGYVRNDSARIS